ncbi:hypothetical protein FRC12_002610 [Ceratobasidium sp. 428]|nr:hypothetical protein FRC09_017617 [Ceratobasidium sp. 395]KAG8796231.1 hypothetical protein FRC12_002610 [Ceratobasidium sp. 428]
MAVPVQYSYPYGYYDQAYTSQPHFYPAHGYYQPVTTFHAATLPSARIEVVSETGTSATQAPDKATASSAQATSTSIRPSLGQTVDKNTLNYLTSSELERTLKQRPEEYCRSCYGAAPPEGSRCCQTCESVRQAYLRQGWSFDDPNQIEQCAEEHWTKGIQEQNSEGCRISGRARINKVTGNVQFSFGRSFVSQKDPYHKLVPYLKDGNHHDFGHHIHEFHFEGEREVEDMWRGDNRMSGWRKKVGLEGH